MTTEVSYFIRKLCSALMNMSTRRTRQRIPPTILMIIEEAHMNKKISPAIRALENAIEKYGIPKKVSIDLEYAVITVPAEPNNRSE